MRMLERIRRALERALARVLPGRADYIGGADVLPAPLSREEEERLVQSLQTDGGQARAGRIVPGIRI